MKFMGRPCPTVVIVSAITGKPVKINKSDYDAKPDKYELFVEEVKATPAKDAVKTEEENTSLKRRVKKTGR
jgi:hypothetical protein